MEGPEAEVAVAEVKMEEESELPCKSISFPLKDSLCPRPPCMNDSVGRSPALSVEERGDSRASSDLGRREGEVGRPRSEPNTGITVVERGMLALEKNERTPEGTRD